MGDFRFTRPTSVTQGRLSDKDGSIPPRLRLGSRYATVAVDGSLHTAGLPAGFARFLHVAVRAVPLLTLLVRGLRPQHWGLGSDGQLMFSGMLGNRHAHSFQKGRSATRQAVGTESADRIFRSARATVYTLTVSSSVSKP